MPRTIYEDQSGCANTYGVLLPLCLLMLMDGMRLWSCPSCPLLTPLSRAGRIDFPWKLSDVKRLLALWCQHSVIPLSVFLYIISGTHHSPFFLVFFPSSSPFFSLPHFTFLVLSSPLFALCLFSSSAASFSRSSRSDIHNAYKCNY